MNQNAPAHGKPRRAEPLQPDRPGRGDAQEESDADSARKDGQGDAEKLRQQVEDGVENAREDYGGGAT